MSRPREALQCAANRHDLAMARDASATGKAGGVGDAARFQGRSCNSLAIVCTFSRSIAKPIIHWGSASDRDGRRGACTFSDTADLAQYGVGRDFVTGADVRFQNAKARSDLILKGSESRSRQQIDGAIHPLERILRKSNFDNFGRRFGGCPALIRALRSAYLTPGAAARHRNMWQHLPKACKYFQTQMVTKI